MSTIHPGIDVALDALVEQAAGAGPDWSDVLARSRFGEAPPLAARRSRRARRAVLVAVVAASVAAVVVVGLPFPGGHTSVIDRALAAVQRAPADSIIHFTSITRDRNGDLTGRTELWSATSPPYARRSIIQGPTGEPIEQGAAGTELTQFDPTGIVFVRTIAGGTAEGTHPADFAADAQRVKNYLRAGKARDEGEVDVNGHVLHRFAVTPAEGGSCVYDVQPKTFYGVHLHCTGIPTGSLSEHWDYLPRQGNERLLSVIARHPSAHIDRAPIAPCGKATHTPSTPPCVTSSPGA